MTATKLAVEKKALLDISVGGQPPNHPPPAGRPRKENDPYGVIGRVGRSVPQPRSFLSPSRYGVPVPVISRRSLPGSTHASSYCTGLLKIGSRSEADWHPLAFRNPIPCWSLYQRDNNSNKNSRPSRKPFHIVLSYFFYWYLQTSSSYISSSHESSSSNSLKI